MAKQIICEANEITLPSWQGTRERPDPPTFEADGFTYRGESVAAPARRAAISNCVSERNCGNFRPDILATDGNGDLLIEVRFTHRVDRRKEYWARSSGYRMFEIDLSHIEPADVEDQRRFCELVLHAKDNRAWISCPETESEWDREQRRLVEQAAGFRQLAATQRQRVVPPLRAPPPTSVQVQHSKIDDLLTIDVGHRLWHVGLGAGTVIGQVSSATPIYTVDFDQKGRRTIVLELRGKGSSWRTI